MNDVTNRTLQVRLHTGAPGANATANAITGAEQDVAAAGWDSAAGGVAENASDINFGVLSTSDSNTVTHYSVWNGATPILTESLAASVTVAANETFKINANTIDLTAAAA